MRITPPDFENILLIPLSVENEIEIVNSNLFYSPLSTYERDKYILSVFDYLMLDNVVSAGEHRINNWDDGWRENLEELKQTESIDALTPKYHGKYNLVHWMGDIVKPHIDNFDTIIHKILVDIVLETYLSHSDVIIEAGCGPAYHLLRTRKFNKNALLVGLDWAKSSQEIIKEIINLGIDDNITGAKFDFYNPSHEVCFTDRVGVYTVAALEQVGAKFEPFIQYILATKPEIVVHLEPIEELLNENNLIDNISIRYFKKRNYLTGYLTRLRKLEKEGKIQIIKATRTYTGSYFIEGHSLIVWRPI